MTIDKQYPMRTQEGRRRQYAIWKGAGATRYDVQEIVLRGIRAAAKENGYTKEEIAPMLAELTADLDNIFGPLT